MILVFDTETTGKANFKKPSTHKDQPRIVQLGALLLDEENSYSPCVEVNLIIRPFGYDIPIEASNIHGVTTKLADQAGIHETAMLTLFSALMERAKVVVAHNIKFDGLVIEKAYSVHYPKDPWAFPWDKTFCTMEGMTPICRLPSAFKSFGSFKWPTLQEAHVHCFNEEFSGAHDAMADVRACARIYRWLKERKTLKGEQVNA